MLGIEFLNQARKSTKSGATSDAQPPKVITERQTAAAKENNASTQVKMLQPNFFFNKLLYILLIVSQTCITPLFITFSIEEVTQEL